MRGRVAAGLVALAVVGVAGCSGSSHGTTATSATSGNGTVVGASTSAQPPASTAPTAGDAFGNIPTIVTQVEPSVVTIITSKGLGSGVVFSAGGEILTDAHVVAGATNGQVTIAFADGKQVTGKVVGADQITDVAIVKADRTNLPAAKFQSTLPKQGALAVVIGSPLGFENTVTAGIISGLHRQIPGSASQETPGGLVDLIQTDAPISPGNSGGAVVNGNGEVVGLSEAYIPPSAGAVALGFATPAATVLDVAHQLLTTGHVKHAFLGIGPTDLTPQIASELGVHTSTGVVVLSVQSGGAAAKAGLQPGDVITKIGGQQVANVTDLLAVLRKENPGQTVPVTVLRAGGTHQLHVTLSDRPAS